jgi:uncharacterized damage-inducible protein DinB
MDATAQMIVDVHRHSSWANEQLLKAAEQLASDELRTPVGEGGYGDLLETLLHMYDAQESWFERARSGKSGPVLEVEDYPDIPTLRAAWERLEADMDAYLAGLDEAALLEKVSYRSFYGSEGTYARTDMMLHQAFHSHQHRGEVALILTQLGHSPGELDFNDYMQVRDGGS